ncbi:TonB-dependent receptor [Aquimarina sp. ERC-38]|uniref:TonB-dependent receptor n=1 Tax=Aquimarina sp. ERC-38 TaxID=2949996 RepID=UPI00224503F0|nr:TonB-dependent receptor [Aquimarina sp. ERC-38]UZO81816.1 TonB-dependent receptor [Aquimarina sp. ERC-38]
MNTYFFIALFTVSFGIAQQFEESQALYGTVLNQTTQLPIKNVEVVVKGTDLQTLTDTNGNFLLTFSSQLFGQHILLVKKPGFLTKKYPLVFTNAPIALSQIYLQSDSTLAQNDNGLIILTDDAIENEENDISYFNGGLLQSSQDVFSRAAAYDFSSAFFRPRGLDAGYHTLSFNGVIMTKIYDNRPQWSAWGGINDVLRNQHNQLGLSTAENHPGNLAGITTINLSPSQLREGGRVSYASSNRTYRNRIMGTYVSGLSASGWAYAFTISKRFAEQGFVEGTPYDANAVFASVENQWKNKHSLQLATWYTPNSRGRSSALTKEVFDLKGNTYNPNWGFFNGEIKNSKTRSIEEPSIFLTYNYEAKHKLQLQSTVALRKGIQKDSRIDNTGVNLITTDDQNFVVGGSRSVHTNPVHQANLPSFFGNTSTTLFNDHQVLQALNFFQNNGQVNWDKIIETNQLQAQKNNNAIYVLYNDQKEDLQLDINSNFTYQLKDHIRFLGGLSYGRVKSTNFAKVESLLGGNPYLDLNVFALDDKNTDQENLLSKAQSDLQNQNRVVGEGERFKYHYELHASQYNSFLQTEIRLGKIATFLGANFNQTVYRRNGIFENGYFPGDQSLGESKKVSFFHPSFKAGIAYQINGRHSVQVNAGYLQQKPTAQQTFTNIRKSNHILSEVQPETNLAMEGSYFLQSPLVKLQLTGYHTIIKDATKNNFYFTETLAIKELAETAAFVQESLTKVHKVHSGLELGISYQIVPTLTLKSVAAIGSFTYQNNPDLQVAIDQGNFKVGKVFLKNYKIARGPQEAYQVGFDYRDPKFWWIGMTTNYFRNSFVAPSALKRTTNFNLDPVSNTVFNDYEEATTKSFLQQEKLPDYWTVNMVGGKSWRIKQYYLGFFLTVSNLLNKSYRSGGYEQSRRVSYRTALEEANRKTPLFGNKYFYGYGSTYFANVYVRF